MTVTKSAPLPSRQTARQWSLTDVTQAGSGLPSRMILHGVEGWGKTSFAAQAPKPIFLQARGETGLETLIDTGRLPQVAHFPELHTFDDTLSIVRMLTTNDHEHRTIVLDTLNGFERLCHEHTCAKYFGGDWSDRGFMGYMRGYENSLAEWRELLNCLDRLREAKKMAIICLCHTKVAAFRNPEGSDYDRYSPDLHAKTWSVTHKWADLVLFGNFETAEKKDGLRTKAVGGSQRIMYCQRTAAFDAKNRHGLPEELLMTTDAPSSWRVFQDALQTARKGTTNV